MVLIYHEKYSKRYDDDFDEFWPIYQYMIKRRTFHDELICRVPFYVLLCGNEKSQKSKKDCEVMLDMLKHVRDGNLPNKNEDFLKAANQHMLEIKEKNEAELKKEIAM